MIEIDFELCESCYERIAVLFAIADAIGDAPPCEPLRELCTSCKDNATMAMTSGDRSDN